MREGQDHADDGADVARGEGGQRGVLLKAVVRVRSLPALTLGQGRGQEREEDRQLVGPGAGVGGVEEGPEGVQEEDQVACGLGARDWAG